MAGFIGRLARIWPVAAIALANKRKESAIVDRRGAHHSDHIHGAAGRAGRRLGAVGVELKHARGIHGREASRAGGSRCKTFDS